jgi:hypothetical protein
MRFSAFAVSFVLIAANRACQLRDHAQAALRLAHVILPVS